MNGLHPIGGDDRVDPIRYDLGLLSKPTPALIIVAGIHELAAVGLSLLGDAG